MSGHCGKALARLLRETFATFRGETAVEWLDATPWASVTFTGARHRFRIALDGDGAVGAAADFLAAMDGMDLPIPGHIVADLALVGEQRGDNGRHVSLEIEALTVEAV